jgi:hypothetical protein
VFHDASLGIAAKHTSRDAVVFRYLGRLVDGYHIRGSAKIGSRCGRRLDVTISLPQGKVRADLLAGCIFPLVLRFVKDAEAVAVDGASRRR